MPNPLAILSMMPLPIILPISIFMVGWAVEQTNFYNAKPNWINIVIWHIAITVSVLLFIWGITHLGGSL